MRSSILALIVALSVPGAALAQEIDPVRLNDHVRELASDALGGRAPASPDEGPTTDYIAHQFQLLGLEPGGDDGSYFQMVPLSRTTRNGPATISVQGADGWTRALEWGPDLVMTSDRPVERITVTDAPLVFVGYGVDAPERGWDDFGDVDLTGKIMVVIVNDPDFQAPEGHPVAGRFDGQAMTYYGRWVYKFAEAARRGAAGVLVIHDTPGAGYPWTTVVSGASAPRFDIVRQDWAAERVPFQGWIQGDVATELFARAGLDLAALRETARTDAFEPVELTGLTMSVDFAQTADRVESRNVVAVLPGAGHPDETVMFGAHWDAYGRGPANAEGDDIYNGAVDNATGVAGILELARVFAEGPRPDRSLMFVSWTAEESGLLGAYHYAAHPLRPLETTVANLNLDSLLPGAEVTPEVVVIGMGKNTLDGLLAPYAEVEGRTLINDPAPQAGGFYRSDHFPLALRGVPALFAAAGFTGASPQSADYVAHRYHQPTDAWDATWTMDAAAQDLDLLYRVARDLANSRAWPEWNEGTEFWAVREESRGHRAD
ncbi:M28 family peptidase [Brevundimonas aveniformis]|uniref:M28 family peptidase n=1 Tax=Brevundimonas aveniformis TaxID=370977 RepID=UPI0024937D1F|nr:M28 family peptidase [Brevundimonas aveniformis]